MDIHRVGRREVQRLDDFDIATSAITYRGRDPIVPLIFVLEDTVRVGDQELFVPHVDVIGVVSYATVKATTSIRAGIQQVISRPAIDRVAAALTEKPIISVSAIDSVLARASVDDVITFYAVISSSASVPLMVSFPCVPKNRHPILPMRQITY